VTRQIAYEVLRRVEEEGAYSHLALNADLEASSLDSRDRGLVTRIVYGVLTWRGALDDVIAGYVDGGLERLDAPVLRCLRMGAYQLHWLDRIPEHAAVDETVAMVESVGWERAGGLVNAVMRQLTDIDEESLQWWRPEDRESNPVRFIADRYSLPSWIANRLTQLFDGERAEAIAEAWTQRPPLFVRATDTEVERAFGSSDQEISRVEGVRNCWRIDADGRFARDLADADRLAIQDLGSQLVGAFPGVQPGDTVLDACAGLGGKTLQLAELVGDDGQVVAVDQHSGKLNRLADSLDARAELGDRVEIFHASLQKYTEFRKEQTDPADDVGFDHVLVDAPCSALGTIRRHPEIRWRRQEADIPDLVETQRELMETAADLVGPGGVLTYAVCTFLTEEAEKQVDRFIDNADDFDLAGPPAGTASDDDIEWKRFMNGEVLRTDPVSHDADMFFAARLRRSEKQ